MKTLIVDSRADSLRVRQVPDSALLTGGRPLFLREEMAAVRFVVMPAVRVSRLGLGVNLKFAPRYYDAMTLVALNAGSGNVPAEEDLIADNALVVGEWTDLPDNSASPEVTVSGRHFLWPALRPGFDRAISAVSQRSTLKTGDIIVLSDPAVGTEAGPDTRLQCALDNRTVLNFKIK